MNPGYKDQIPSLNRIEGQIKGGASKNGNFGVIFLPVIWTLSLKSI